MGSLRDTSAWNALLNHSEQFKHSDFRLSELFKVSANRFESFSITHENLLLDFSKNYVTDKTLQLLVELANQCELRLAIEAMFAGQEINSTEQQAALHIALREPPSANKHPEVADALSRMENLTNAIHSGSWTGYSGKKITDVVNLGIGGSESGPAMVTDALSGIATGDVNVHFVSNVDPSHLENTLAELQGESTLFIIASKSFATMETLQNANEARNWLLQQAQHENAIANHFVATCNNLEAATAFGIDESNIFPVWDWVGGRYSLWSAIGLPIALYIGMENFRRLLAGAHSMDQHFLQTELARNLPVIMGLMTVWYTGFFDCHSTAVVPYSQQLKKFPSYLQQLYMESLGKSVDVDGNPVSTNTGEVLWGSAGTDAQHSYFQLLHQGTGFIPVDFIAIAKSTVHGKEQQHKHLLANCFSQSLALMEGSENKQEPHKHFVGNKPSNTLLLSEIDPYNLGCLIALYEHKVYVQSVLWNINAFDQWGVELGKRLSTQIHDAMEDSSSDIQLDDSTANLIARASEWNR